jgi:hypothetical protein
MEEENPIHSGIPAAIIQWPTKHLPAEELSRIEYDYF